MYTDLEDPAFPPPPAPARPPEGMGKRRNQAGASFRLPPPLSPVAKGKAGKREEGLPEEDCRIIQISRQNVSLV